MRLFEVNVVKSKELQCKEFIKEQTRSGLIRNNKAYFSKHEVSVAYYYLKLAYGALVVDGKWTRDRFVDIMLRIVKDGNELRQRTFIEYPKKA